VSPIPERHGLQPERTALAWQRTAITATVALIPPLFVPGLLLSFVAAGLVAGVGRRLRQLTDDESRHSPWWPMWRLAAVTVLSAGGGVVTTALLLVTDRG